MSQSKPTMYAWARSIGRAPLWDHTFLTDYVEPFEGNPPPRSWFCAGGVYSSDDPEVRRLLAVEADLDLATFVCRPDDPGDTAGIVYAVHGVCHQIANRILYAAHSPDVAKPLVSDARGYVVSCLFFSDYGKNEVAWRARLSRYE